MFRRFSPAVTAVVASTTATRGASVNMENYTSKRNQLKVDVMKQLKDHKIFSQAMFDKCADRFFGLDLEWTYVSAFSADIVAKHLVGFATATAEAELGKPFEYAFEGRDFCFWFCEYSTESQLRTQRRIERYFLNHGSSSKGVSLRSYSSPQGNTVLYTLSAEEFNKPDGQAKAVFDAENKIREFAGMDLNGDGHLDLAELTQIFDKETAQALMQKWDLNKNGRISLAEFLSPEKYPLQSVSTPSFFNLRSTESHLRYADILSRLSTSIVPVYNIRSVEDDVFNVTMGFLPDRTSYLTALTTLFGGLEGASITKRFMETFSNGQQVYSFFVKGVTREALEKTCIQIGMLPHRPDHLVTQLYNSGIITPAQVTYCHSLIIFAFYFTPPAPSHDFDSLAASLTNSPAQLERLKKMRLASHQEVMSEDFVTSVLHKHVKFVLKLYDTFAAGALTDAQVKELYQLAEETADGAVEANILAAFVRFNQAVVKTNFFKVKRAAACYRLDPKVFMQGLDYPTMPYGVFLIVGAQFRGFHVRFSDIARGGIRMILSKGNKYRSNRLTLFQENYNLAHAQLLKNKDIPEAGSKGTLLVSPRRGPNPKVMYLQYIDAVLDCLLPGESGVRDLLPKPEILFMGPDENTAGELPSIAAFHAKNRGYKQWKSFTTGKGQNIGGIPHDIYGMTTQSVRANVEAIYKEKGLEQKNLVKFQTGGPDGDLGSNEIMRSEEKYIGLVDISGVVYDPEGVNKDELVRLAKKAPNLRLKDFDTSKLSPKGFFIGADETHRTLPDGTHVESGEKFRDEFHFNNYVRADTFVPCGGRPSAITIDNVHRLLVDCPDFTGETMLYGKVGDLASQGKTRFKYIVEGANLFLTHNARLALENVGVVVVKDSSANKGGVTSSSIEVLAALSLTDEEHATHMCVKDGHFPEFYNKIVEEIVQRVRYNATREFEAVSAEVAKGTLDGKRTLIADALSRNIVNMRATVAGSALFDDLQLREYVLRQYVPKQLLTLVSIDDVLSRVPENYLRASFATYIASDYVYSTGLNSSEFSFFEYMHKLHAAAAKK